MLTPYYIDNDLELRVLDTRYAKPLFDIVDQDREYLRQWQNWPDKIRTIHDMRRSLHFSMQKRRQNTGLDFVLIYRGAPVGKIGLVYINWREKTTEVGYWLAQKLQGNGFISRAAQVLTGYALGVLQLEQVQIRCSEGNMRSRAIPERLGFAYDGTYESMTRLHGEYVTDVIYTMTARRWYRRMIYHITTRAEWQRAQESGGYRAASLETQDFIHFSRLNQVVKVANAFYTGQQNLVLLCVDPERLRVPVRFEPPDNAKPTAQDDADELFPHVYGVVDVQAVIRVLNFAPNGDGTFGLPPDLP